MSNSQPRRTNGLFAPRVKKERRPAGVSRRRRQQLNFESLESRQVMSANPIVQPFSLDFGDATNVTFNSTSTAGGAAGQQEALDRELWWYSQMAGNSALGTRSIPNDPLFPFQWHLLNTGQDTGSKDAQPILGVVGEDINVVGAWNLGYTGEGVTVAVLDSGTQLNHPDLAGNINFDLAFDALSPLGNGNPSFADPGNAHGTAVAGLIGAIANNGIGGAGVAPGVSLVPVRLIDSFVPASTDDIVEAFRHTTYNGIDITNNSWGPTVVRGIAGPGVEEFLALRDSVFFGRGGKGVIHVFASGNDGGPGMPEGFPSLGGYDSAAYDGWINSRYTIGVTGVDHDGFYNNVNGTITAYPEISPGVLVAAPTGSNAGPVIANDTGLGSGLWTTDLTGDYGYNVAPDRNGQEILDSFYPFDRDFLENTNYTSRFNGTSASAPIVSGVIALMLEANPDLTWRDVQEILVRSARQNAPFGVPTDGQGFGTQNTWIVNQIPIFHDLDIDLSLPDPFRQLWQPTQDPNYQGSLSFGLFQTHHAPAPFMMTNGAGYTVSQGYGARNEQIGYGHGVVDAELAVRLAEQWHTKNQALPPELTYTSSVQAVNVDLHPAEQGNIRTGYIIVPGGLGSDPGWIDLYNEFVAEMPNFDREFELRGLSALPLSVPDSQAMSIENVELKISISGGTAAALDNVRMLLISPDGTHSEMNHFWIGDKAVNSGMQSNIAENVGLPMGSPGSVDTNPEGALVATFRSVRHWGERSDDAIVFDPRTGMPVTFGATGAARTQGWRVVIENWGNADLDVNGIELAWHGRPVNAQSQRITGAIGIDEDGNDDFNFSRVVQVSTGEYLGNNINIPDVNQEDFAENVTVVARRASDNQVVARFVTGHDGNFYFDLVPDEYIISIEDPLNRPAADDTLTPDGLLDHYRAEWHITPEHFTVWQKSATDPTETLTDANGVPIPWEGGAGQEQVYGIKGLNFLLDPGDPAPDEVSFSGTVYADVNGDGVFNGNDTALPNVTVYVDFNKNGAFDAGEVSVETDANGQYNITKTGITAPTSLNVGVLAPAQWTTTNPDDGVHDGPLGAGLLVDSGQVYAGLDFFLNPPDDNAGGGGVDQPGFLIGSVFEDLNADGQRNGLETGVEGVWVYLDVNNNGAREEAETATQTNAFGAYSFGGVAPGQHFIRIDVASPLVQTTPLNDEAHVVTLTGSSTISGLHFGILDLAVNDFGDLPEIYETRPDGVLDPAHHKKSKYRLGTTVDGELTNEATPGANGDNLEEIADEDGVVLVDPFVAGTTARLQVTANTHTTFLQGWIDWNNDGDFLDGGERVATDQLLVAGTNIVTINVPGLIGSSEVYARFRLGLFSTDPATGAKRVVDTPFGLGGTGEVEDYLLPVADTGAVQGDFDGDQDVDGRDFLSWQRNLGKSSGATQAEGDADADGDVDGDDLGGWQDNFGSGSGAAVSSSLPAGSAAGSGSLSVLGGSWISRNALDAASWSVSTEMSSDIGTLADSPARPVLSRIAGRLSNLADRLEAADGKRLDKAAEKVGQAAARIADRIDSFNLQALRRDRAFDELFERAGGADGLEDLAAELAETSDSDEAFAELAEHFAWRGR